MPKGSSDSTFLLTKLLSIGMSRDRLYTEAQPSNAASAAGARIIELTQRATLRYEVMPERLSELSER